MAALRNSIVRFGLAAGGVCTPERTEFRNASQQMLRSSNIINAFRNTMQERC
jgi:hypothetical protein